MANLRAYPFDPVRFECRACGCTLEYQKEKLIRQYGNLALPEIRLAVARDSGCETAGNKTPDAPPCGIVYSDLVCAGTISCCGAKVNG